MTSSDFLAALHRTVADLRTTVQTEFLPLTSVVLNQRPAPSNWSILECLEHLNRYSRYYNAALAKSLAKVSVTSKPSAEVGYTWLGRKSVDMMHPTNTKKQATLKHMNPLGSCLGLEVLGEFDQHQARLLELLVAAQAVDLNRKAVPVEFFRLLKLRVGEALEFVVVHQQRHLQQAQRVRAALQVELAC